MVERTPEEIIEDFAEELWNTTYPQPPVYAPWWRRFSWFPWSAQPDRTQDMFRGAAARQLFCASFRIAGERGLDGWERETLLRYARSCLRTAEETNAGEAPRWETLVRKLED